MVSMHASYNLAQWLSFLETRHAVEMQLGLERVQALAAHCNLQALPGKVITVAGTNGKGSTIAMLESLYVSAGYQVGSYTSPHLMHFNERIRINQRPIADEQLCRAFAYLEAQPGGFELTYFETATLAAFWYFKQHPLDIVLLEVGLGGRLDATNIIDADLAIITTIALDHEALLGDTLEAIGFEKAGILRKNKPCIYGDRDPPTSILHHAARLSSPCYLYGEDYDLEIGEDLCSWRSKLGSLPLLPIAQIHPKAVASALMASELLQPQLPITHAHRSKALAEVFIPGRQQWQKGSVKVLYDVSHNPQSAEHLAHTLRHFIKTNKAKPQIHAVFSALEDKNIAGMLAPLIPLVSHWYPATLACKRAASREELLSQCKKAAKSVNFCYNSPLIAFEQAHKGARPGDLIVVFGSFYTVAAVMSSKHYLLQPKEKSYEISIG